MVIYPILVCGSSPIPVFLRHSKSSFEGQKLKCSEETDIGS